jgi:3,4-dihydroxy 2-butanone 4-phosphate synthase/3,4-dihydroxy 2-butanone 4-phosphate synthase/GTP cyclohydrolase II
VLIYDPDREAEADVVFPGARLRPESMAFLLTQVCGHTTVPCDRDRLDRLEIGPMPGTGDRHGTAYHVSVDLAAGTGTGVSAHDRAATIRRTCDRDQAITPSPRSARVRFPARAGGRGAMVGGGPRRRGPLATDGGGGS